MVHTCHHPGCKTEVPPKLWGCAKHWFRLPENIRNRILAAYRPGQEVDKNPSEAYIDAAYAAYEWCMDNPEAA